MNPAQLLAHFDRIGEAPDAIPRLRRFILDLAVRGKLVEQDPRDEAASELVRRIYAEKGRLVREGTIRKQNLKTEIEADEIPFALPDQWAWVRLGDVIHLVSGQHLQPSEYSDQEQSGPPYITGPADFGDDGLVITRYAVAQKAVAKKGQILLTVKGAGVGKTAICDLPDVAISRQLMAMTAIEWSQQFLLLVTHRLAEMLKENARSLIPGISREDVDQFVFPLPPLAEQHRIVAKVDELMALCDRLEAAQTERESRRNRLVAASLHNLNNGADPDAFREHARFYFNHLPRLTTRPDHIKQLRQTILNLAVRGKLVPQDPTDEPASELLKRIQEEKMQLIKEGRIPKQKQIRPITTAEFPYGIPRIWQWERLGNLVQNMTNGIYKPSGFYADNGVLCLRMYNIKDGQINYNNGKRMKLTTEELETYRLQKGDLLVNRVNSRELVGKAGPIPQCDEPLIFESKNIRVRMLEAEVLPYYVNLLFQTVFFRAILEGYAKQACGQATVSQPQIAELPVPLPPLAEQHRIIAKVDELMALCDQLETQLTTTKSETRHLLNSILHEALAKQTVKV